MLQGGSQAGSTLRQFLLFSDSFYCLKPQQARALRGRGGLPVTTYMRALLSGWRSPWTFPPDAYLLKNVTFYHNIHVGYPTDFRLPSPESPTFLNHHQPLPAPSTCPTLSLSFPLLFLLFPIFSYAQRRLPGIRQGHKRGWTG